MVSQRISDKLEFFAYQEDPIQFANVIRDPRFGNYRFRIGRYRVIFDIEKENQINVLFILRIKHRKEAYR